MGLFQPVYSVNGPAIEFALLELLDLSAQRTTSPGVDDVMGTPFRNDRGDGVGARVRPTTQVTLRCKAAPLRSEEQILDQVGDDPDSRLQLTLYEEDLIAAGLLVNGILKLKADDRLAKLLNSDGIQAPDGTIRVDFTHGGTRPGLRCYEVRPAYTGARTYLMLFESQKASASA